MYCNKHSAGCPFCFGEDIDTGNHIRTISTSCTGALHSQYALLKSFKSVRTRIRWQRRYATYSLHCDFIRNLAVIAGKKLKTSFCNGRKGSIAINSRSLINNSFVRYIGVTLHHSKDGRILSVCFNYSGRSTQYQSTGFVTSTVLRFVIGISTTSGKDNYYNDSCPI